MNSAAPIGARINDTRLVATKAEDDGVATTPGDPDELVGKGSNGARFLGGAAGFGIGLGAAIGVTALAQRSPIVPLRYIAATAGLGAMVGAPYVGQKLLGHATRSTRAETERAQDAKVADIKIERDQKVAEAYDRLSSDEIGEVQKLRSERLELAKAGPEQNWFAQWGLPVLVGVGTAALAGFLAYRFSPDDGKGINQAFNMIGAIPLGGGIGAGIGATIGNATMPGTRFSELPADNAARITEIDARLDELLDDPAS